MGHGGAAAIFAAGGLGTGGGFPPGGGGGACCGGFGPCTVTGGPGAGGGFPLGGGGACCIGAGVCDAAGRAGEGGVELVRIGGVDRSAALNEGPAIIPVDGACPFPFVVGNEPGSAVVGLVYPKTEPVCRVGG
jgi:hypothetical protein